MKSTTLWVVVGVILVLDCTTSNAWEINNYEPEPLGQLRHRRSIDLSAAHSLIPDTKLPTDVYPTSYVLFLRPNLGDSSFKGRVRINATWAVETNKITLHAHHDLLVSHSDVKVTQTASDDSSRTATPIPPKVLAIKRTDRHPKKPIYTIHLTETLKRGSEVEIDLSFSGTMWEGAEGLFRGSYPIENEQKNFYVATYMRPNNARRVFPCFDEPSYKVRFNVSIARPKTYTTLFNTAVLTTEPINDDSNYVIDHFQETPKMSTFTFGFVISQLVKLNASESYVKRDDQPLVQIWSRPNIQESLEGTYEKAYKIIDYIKEYLGAEFPLCKLDIVALPGLSSVKPADNWGLIVLKESEILTKGYSLLSQEIAYQWLGSWATPYWWSDAHVNKAVVGFIASSTALEVNHGIEFNGKWPMMVLYSIYYEFSKRYPHSRITGMKQETTCSKTELVLRMLNITLGPETFKKGIQQFFGEHQCNTFFADDIWNALTKVAQDEDKICKKLSLSEVVGSWISKDRLPIVTITRNYEKKEALAQQKVYLRERPHDVPEQDKLLWYIPLTIVTQNNLNFDKVKVEKWMKKEKNVTLTNLPDANKFIIVNPEEIGPFPVNYDYKNWNLLAAYLKTDEGRKSIPTYTKAKLIHDAWNLAYAGELDFATAFNMISFIKHERDHIVWDPIFTFIDHIGRHIDSSNVHKKFEKYVLVLLTPLYEELGSVAKENEASWKENQRSLARTFLCRSGYKPCVAESQTAYKKWMEQENPDEGNPVPNQYICPVFKWGSQEEWDFALDRVINFPSSRKQSERTYLLKTLAGCPVQKSKIEKLLNLTIIEENGNFTENDIYLIFSMLTGGSSGYTTLFEFLSSNWDFIKVKFQSKTNLWDNLIGSATGSFKTQEGYDKVSELYVQRQGEFGSAEHIIEKSLRNIKEELKWSNENIPVIEKWLEDYLKNENQNDQVNYNGRK